MPFKRRRARFVSDTLALRAERWRLASGEARPYIGRVVKITISPEALQAIAGSLPPESIAVEPEGGKLHIWLPRHVADKLKAMRGRGDSYSDVILRIPEATAAQ
jgi:hypothetical protein